MGSPKEAIDLITHVNRNANGSALIGDRSGNCLTYPPGSVSREFVASTIIEFLSGSNETDVPLLNQIQERDTAPHVLLGNANHQARIGGDQMLSRRPTILNEESEAGAVAVASSHGLARLSPAFNSL